MKDPSITSTVALLQAARQWLSVKEHWNKKAFFTTEYGIGIIDSNIPHKLIASTCAVGALYLIARQGTEAKLFPGDAHTSGAITALSLAVPEGKTKSAIYYNDNPATTHEDVLAMYDRAIANLQKQEITP